ncbi:MAG: hypothetical protein WC054_00265 [Candidatus Nanopelagicales bacterium]
MTNTQTLPKPPFTVAPGYVNAFLILSQDELPYWQTTVTHLLSLGYRGALTVKAEAKGDGEDDFFATRVEFEGSVHAATQVYEAMRDLYVLVNLEG